MRMTERGSAQMASRFVGWLNGPQATGHPTLGRGMRNERAGAQQVAADNRFPFRISGLAHFK